MYGTVIVAGLHPPVRLHDRTIYYPKLDDGTEFYALSPPHAFDAQRQPVLSREVPPGSKVRVKFRQETTPLGMICWMSAVQILELADDCPF